MAWVINLQSGVQQDARGRHFRIATNSRGKQDIVYVEHPTNAERARMIPVPPEPVYFRKEKFVTTDDGTGKKRNVVHLPKRKCVCEFRYRNSQDMSKIERDSFSDFENSASLGNLHAMCDWHVFYHIEVKSDGQALG